MGLHLISRPWREVKGGLGTGRVVRRRQGRRGRQGGPACGAFHDGLDTGPGWAALPLGTVSTADGSPPTRRFGEEAGDLPRLPGQLGPASPGAGLGPTEAVSGEEAPLSDPQARESTCYGGIDT